MIDKKLDEFIRAAQRMHLEEYVRFQSDRRARMKDAFYQGIFRGLGAMVGFSIIGALLLYILQVVIKDNLPYISDFIVRLLSMVEGQL